MPQVPHPSEMLSAEEYKEWEEMEMERERAAEASKTTEAAGFKASAAVTLTSQI